MTINNYVRKNAFKIVVAGDGGVGKTTVAKRISGNLHINEDLKMTPGIDFQSVIVESYKPIDCQIWDLGGQEQFRKIQDDFFNGAAVIILIFTVDRYSSFMNLKSWISLVPKNLNIKFFLLANKIDSQNRVVSKQQANEFAHTFNMSFYEISALTGVGFNEFKEDLFKTIEYEFIVKDKD